MEQTKPQPAPSSLLTAQDMARRLGVSYSRVRQLALAAGGSIGVKIGSQWLFTESDVDAFRNRSSMPGRKVSETT